MKNFFKLTRLWVASLLLLFGFTTNAWAKIEFVVGVTGTGTSSSYGGSDYNKMKINTHFNWDNTEKNWVQTEMSKAGMTFEGLDLYITKQTYDDAIQTKEVQFQKYKNDDQKYSWVAYNGKQDGSYWNNQIVEYGGGKYSKLTMYKPRVYFNPEGWNQTDIKVVVGHANYQAYYSLSKITNTNLYFGYLTSMDWGDAMGFGVVGGTTASDGTNWLTNVSSEAKEYTGFLHYGLNQYKTDGENAMYYVTNAGTTGQKPSCDYHANYTDLNKTQTIKVMVKAAGGSYSEKTYGSWPADIKVKRYKLNSNGASSADETDADLTSATFTSVITSAAKIYKPTPSTGYTFKGWGTSSSAIPSNASSDYEYTVSDATTIYLFFDENTYSVTAAQGTGCASVSPTGAQTVGQLTGKQFTATASAGYSFDNWTSNNGGTFSTQAATTTFKPTGDATITANFTEVLTSVTISSNGNGTVDPTSANVGVATTQSVTATPADGYHFASWAVTGNADIKSRTTDNPVTLYGNGSGSTGTLTATFAETLYTITITGGTEATTSAGCVTTGTATAAAAATGKKFDKWELGTGITLVDCAVTDQTIAFHASQAATVTATYTDASKYNLNVVAGTGISAVTGEKLNQTSLPIESDITATVMKGYNFVNWTASGDGTATFTDATATSTHVTVKNGSVTVTANAEAIASNLTLNGNGGEPASQILVMHYNDASLPNTYVQPSRTGYDYSGYGVGTAANTTKIILQNNTFTTSSGDTQSKWVTNGKWTRLTDGTLYACWTAHYKTLELNKNYTVGATKGQGNHGSGKITVGTKVAENYTAATRTGHTLLGYSVDEEGEIMVMNPDGSFIASQTGNYTDAEGNWIQDITDGTITRLYAQWEENLTTLTIAANEPTWGTMKYNNSSTDWNHVVTVGLLQDKESKKIIATAKPGYTFTGWTIPEGDESKITIEPGEGYIVVRGTGLATNTATIQANFIEDLSSGIYVEGDNPPFGGWSTAAANEMLKATGHSTSNDIYYHFTTTKVDQDADFKLFDKNHNPGWLASSGYWWYSYCTEQTFSYDSELTNMKFIGTVIGDYVFHYNTNTKKFDITYPDVYCLMGAFNSWSSTSHPFDRTSNQVSIELEENKEYAFRVVYQGKYFRVDGQMTSSNCTDWNIYNDGSHGIDIKIKTTVAGTYTFTFNPMNEQLSVSYPGENYRTVTVDNGETKTQVDVKEVTETPLVASQYLNGMRFDRWVVTNSEGVVQENKITINTPTSCSTHMHGAKENGLIVKATYTTQGIVYLDKQYIKGDWPGDVFVYFYKGAYWDDTNKELGSGSKQTDANCISDGKQMTRVNDKSDIYYYDYSGDNLTNRAEYISFVDQREDKYDNFVACQAIYRGDFQECSPMFVPRNWKYYYNRDAPKGRAVYYQEGYWRTYNSTDAGLSLHFWKGSVETVVPFTSESKNDNTFTAKITISDVSNDTYFKLRCCGGDGNNMDYWYGCKSGMSATSCTNYRFYSGNNTENVNCGIGLTSTGDYIFKLSLADGQVFVSVEYPLSNGDYRLVSVTDGKVHDNGMFYKSSTDRVDTASFFITKDHTSVVKLQKCTDATSVPAKWADVDGKSIATSGYTTGIYNFTFTQSSESSKEIAKLGEYTGDFYIRTAIAAGGWDAYKGSDDNLLPYIEYGLDESQPFKFTHAYTNWVEKDKNVKFCIANDYSLCVSDTLVGDDVIGTGENADWLNKEGANIRFMWNKKTNEVKRAYIGGSTDDAARFLMLLRANGNMYNSSDVAIDDLKFADKNNWVYQADIKAQPGCAVKLTANYNEYTQYFIGAAGDGVGSSKTIINSSAEDTKHYTMRAVYDFKTNRLTAGWVPDGTPIEDQIDLGGDMLITRTHQQSAQQITFGDNGEVSEIQHIYGVLTLQKDVMAGTEGNLYNDKATNANYEKTMYWISFPFDVNISEIFGVDGYGKKWIMQKYNGQRRADIGWFAETSTFWEYMDISEKLNAYEGYLFIVDANYFNTTDADVWKNSATEANFYFPSAEKNIGIINKDADTITVPEHECKINRTFGDNMNHMITDSHWNVIGVPTFQNSTASTIDGTYNDFKSYYAWVPTTNSYSAQTTLGTTITFNTMQAYMVQYAGTITWQNVSVVAKKAPYAYADEKNYMIELFFNGNGAEDHTYINLADEASTDFVLNEDMMKIDNAGQPNIYSFAGAYNVAYNETTFDNQMVVLGVSAPKDGSYTFAMPKDFSGKAVLVDLETGESTDLNLSNYTVELNKGTYNNRFQLLLEVEAKAPTKIDNAKGEWSADGKTKKLFINDNIYLINAGRIYNASGTQVK